MNCDHCNEPIISYRWVDGATRGQGVPWCWKCDRELLQGFDVIREDNQGLGVYTEAASRLRDSLKDVKWKPVSDAADVSRKMGAAADAFLAYVHARKDHVDHYGVSYALVALSTDTRPAWPDMGPELNGLIASLLTGLEKECSDIGMDQHQFIELEYACLCVAQTFKGLLGEIKHWDLDQGDLAYDVAGAAQAFAELLLFRAGRV